MTRRTAQVLWSSELCFQYHRATFGTWMANLSTLFSHLSFSKGKLHFLTVFFQTFCRNRVNLLRRNSSVRDSKREIFPLISAGFSLSPRENSCQPGPGTKSWRAGCVHLAHQSPLSISFHFISLSYKCTIVFMTKGKQVFLVNSLLSWSACVQTHASASSPNTMTQASLNPILPS